MKFFVISKLLRSMEPSRNVREKTVILNKTNISLYERILEYLENFSMRLALF